MWLRKLASIVAGIWAIWATDSRKLLAWSVTSAVAAAVLAVPVPATVAAPVCDEGRVPVPRSYPDHTWEGCQLECAEREHCETPKPPIDVGEAALQALAKALTVEPDAVMLMHADPATWPSGALGCPLDGFAYTQAEVDGWRFRYAHGGRAYFVHASADWGRVRSEIIVYDGRWRTLGGETCVEYRSGLQRKERRHQERTDAGMLSTHFGSTMACPKGFAPAPYLDRMWGGCWTVCDDAFDPMPSADDHTGRPSFIMDVRLLEPPAGSDGYRLRVVSARNSSSCTRYGGYGTQRTGPQNIAVTIFHYVVRFGPGVRCTKDMVTDVTLVPLGSGFEAGAEYTVTVNGDISVSFIAN